MRSLYSAAGRLKKPGFCWDELETGVTFTTIEDFMDVQTCEKPGFWPEWRDGTRGERVTGFLQFDCSCMGDGTEYPIRGNPQKPERAEYQEPLQSWTMTAQAFPNGS